MSASLRFLAAFARRAVSGHVSLAVETDIRNRLFGHLETLGLDFYLRSQTGQLISRSIADVRAVRLFLSYGFIFLVNNIVTLLAVSVILLLLQPRLAVVALLPMPFLLMAATRFSSRLHPSLYAVQQRVAELTAVVEERIIGIRVIKALAIEDVEQETFAGASDRIFRQNLEAAAIRARYLPLMTLLPSISLVVILYLGGRMVVAGSMTLGSLLAFNSYVALLVWPMRMLGMLVSWAERASASGERVIELLDERPRHRGPRPGQRRSPPSRARSRSRTSASGSTSTRCCGASTSPSPPGRPSPSSAPRAAARPPSPCLSRAFTTPPGVPCSSTATTCVP